MSADLYIASRHGLFTAFRNGDVFEAGRRILAGEITAVMAREGTIIAGSTRGLQRSTDGGTSWEPVNRGLTHPHVRWLAFHPGISDLEFAGTEPAEIYVSRNGGDSWQNRPEVAALREELGWWLPYSSRAGCVRDFAFHGDRAYAAVEVGGLLRSDDKGASWQLAPGSDGIPRFRTPPAGFLHPDVHSVRVHPASADLVFAFTNAGTYRSTDGGVHWVAINAAGYTRAGWLDPVDPDHLMVAPAADVGRGGKVLVSRDGGRSWHAREEGLGTPWADDIVERFYQVEQLLFAVTGRGRLFVSEIGRLQWRQVLGRLAGINAVARPS